MKVFSFLAIATLGLAACGTNSEFVNKLEPTSSYVADSLDAQEDEESLGLKK